MVFLSFSIYYTEELDMPPLDQSHGITETSFIHHSFKSDIFIFYIEILF